MLALRFLPPLAWTALILCFSTSQSSSGQTGSVLLPLLRALLPWATPEQFDFLHWLIRETAHVVEYGVLGGLWLWTLGRSEGTSTAPSEASPGNGCAGKAGARSTRDLFQGAHPDTLLSGGLKALVPSLITAVLDETNQAFSFARSGSAADVALDAAAAGAAISVLAGRPSVPLAWLTDALLWLAALGGTALLALHVVAAAPEGRLWLSVPAAWIALWLRRRRRRAPPPREAPAESREAPPESAQTGP
jgi:VanZ family protein